MLKKLLSLLMIGMLLIMGMSTMAEEAPSSESKAVEDSSEEESSSPEDGEDEAEITPDATLAPEGSDALDESSSSSSRRATAAPTANSDEGLLQRGSSGERVRQLQEKLNELDYNAGYADGQFGPRTEAAVLKYQQDYNLVQTGTVNKTQFDALMTITAPELTMEPTEVPETVPAQLEELARTQVNILNNSAMPRLGESSYEEGVWRSASSGNGTRDIVEIEDAPVEGILYGIRIVNTEETEKYTMVAIDDVPVEYGQAYVLSCYAKGTGTLRLMCGNNPYISVNISLDTGDDWQRCASLYIPNESSNFHAEDTTTKVFFGVPSKTASDVTICGMQFSKIELTEWAD